MRRIFYRLSLLLLVGCSAQEPGADEVKLVLEGWINSGGCPVVVFSRAINPGEGGTFENVPVQWGRVTISDGEDTVVLTGGPDRNFFPPYKYYTYGMDGVPGRTYTISGDDGRGNTISATCRMPEPTPIDSVTFEDIDNDSLIAATAHFTAPAIMPDGAEYYMLTMTPEGRNQRPLPTLFGTIEAKSAGAHMSIPIYHPKHNFGGDYMYVPQLYKGERVTLTLCHITREVYDFYRAYDNMIAFGSSQFLGSSGSLPGNTSSGIGVWSAQGASTIRFTAPK